MMHARTARYGLGQRVRHVHDVFDGLIVDVDARYQGPLSEIDGISPEQPFYSVMVRGRDGFVIAYTAEEALEIDTALPPLTSSEQQRLFNIDQDGHHAPRVHGLQ